MFLTFYVSLSIIPLSKTIIIRNFFRPQSRIMDVLVKWRNGKRNVVSSQDLKTVDKNMVLRNGAAVKMYWPPRKRFFYGTVIKMENEIDSDTSEDNASLADIKRRKLNKTLKSELPKCENNSANVNTDDNDIPLSILKQCSKNEGSIISDNKAVPDVELQDVMAGVNTDDDDIPRSALNQSLKNKVPIINVKKPVPDVNVEYSVKSNISPEVQLPPENLSDISRKESIAISKKKVSAMPEKDSISLSAMTSKSPDDIGNNNFHGTDGAEGPVYKQCCEFKNCKGETFAACFRCEILLCWNHFDDNENCNSHGNYSLPETNSGGNKNLTSKEISLAVKYAVDGEQREVPLIKEKKANKKNIAQALRVKGQAYISPKNKTTIPAKVVKPRCRGKCKGKECATIEDNQRDKIFNAFYSSNNLHQQREFIVRHIAQEDIQRKKTGSDISRRTKTLKYKLPTANGPVNVCKTMFLNTLGISEKMVRTALSKVCKDGAILGEKRGGRYDSLKGKDAMLRASALEHINKFPKMESHFCRKSTTREYLHADLTVKKMYYFYRQERTPEQLTCSYHTYRRVFKSLNLSFHHPKKDQCSLCMTYRLGDAAKKRELEDTYNAHTAQKITVRQKKTKYKELSMNYPTIVNSAVFDMQQVIQLPISNESAIFYKSRLSVFNFTIYNLANKECLCFLWDETISKRGANEISTCVAKYLHELDGRGLREVKLFADGCGGQNRNTIVFSMLLYTVTNAKYLTSISLNFFETNHGQNEGDSAHSSISTALSKAGDIFIPAQLPPILKLARRSMPYKVIKMENADFYDYKSLSEQIRLRSIRKFENGKDVDWTKVKEVKVDKVNVTHLLVKNSHLAENYDTLSLKRNTLHVMTQPLQKCNTSLIKLKAEKYKCLMDLCKGPIPVVKDPTFQKYFRDLRHE